jgi:TonB family protein
VTVARESQALVASLAFHLLLLLVLVLARQPTREPRAPVLRLTLPELAPDRGVPGAAPAATPVGSGARAISVRSRLVMPGAAASPRAFDAPVVGRAAVAGAGLLPQPATALAAALAAHRSRVPAAPVPVVDSAPPLPRVTRYGLPAVRRGVALPYPAELITRGLEADVVMRLTVAADGRVVGAEVLRSSGLSTVDAEVQQALRQYLFAASAERTVSGTVQVRYRLERGF